jgi:transcription termination factor Rho
MFWCILTGGIACGKSAVLRQLAGQEGVVVFSADEAVKAAYERPEVARAICLAAGLEPQLPISAERKVQIRQKVLTEPGVKAAIEAILHPLAFKAMQEAKAEAEQQYASSVIPKRVKVFVAEVPLYYETGRVLDPDLVIVVAASRVSQLSRLCVDRGLDRDTAEALLNIQLPVLDKAERADIVLWNDGSMLQFQRQILLLTQTLSQRSMTEILEEAAATADNPILESTPLVEGRTLHAEAPSLASNTDDYAAQSVADSLPEPEIFSVNEMQGWSMAQLQALAEKVGWRTNASRSKHQLIFDLMGWMGVKTNSRFVATGVLEIGPEGYGMVRYPKFSFAALPEDIFVPSYLIKKFALRPGQELTMLLKTQRDKEKYAAVDRLTHVEGVEIDRWEQPTPFDNLTVLHPNERIILETSKNASVTSRVIDMVAPVGKGQRGLIVASPRSGKTMVLKEMARSIIQNHPEVVLMVLLLDERPEEVTDFEETVNCQIYASTFDEPPKRHSQVADVVSERAKRLVEMGKDVIILLDSLTRLARGSNAMQGGAKGGRTGSGGVDTKALIKPRKFFGSARNIENGGSLTILATALVETESRMDDVIFEEFKGTGNLEIVLDRETAERRIYPAIHVTKSGTRKDDLLYHPDEYKRVSVIRKQLASVPAAEALEMLIRNIQRTGSNAEILMAGLK